ncbi:MAG: hypothetical protein LBS11_01445 [Oscillospiraceae bacterium]|jgi:acetyl-CoA C-acetyltransferase|nr:hypothetical protein [Oscillospiraceae bacterium]
MEKIARECHQSGVNPSIMGPRPVPAIGQALERASLTLTDIDVIELNEAFATQSIGVKKLFDLYGIQQDNLYRKTNINSGAIALGHPVGASWVRITVTLAHILRRCGSGTGLAALCVGGGMGVALALKAIDSKEGTS